MKRNTWHNTGCGNNNNNACPPMPACDVANSRSTGCDVTQFGPNDFEQNVILADFDLSIPVEADIKLPSYARDIKEIRKNVHLTQCKAIQLVGNPDQVNLFVEGYVHKNIQYAEECSGWLRDHSVNVPFKCYERINLSNPIDYPVTSNKNSGAFELREAAANGMEADRCNFGSQTFEFFNIPIDCRLMFATIDQWDIAKNFDNWGRFNKITEKMNVTLAILLTQEQQANFLVPDNGCPEDSQQEDTRQENTPQENAEQENPRRPAPQSQSAPSKRLSSIRRAR